MIDRKTETQNKEHLILEAAEKEFFSKGYDGARTTSIAKQAGVTHAMLHYYFRTKEQLFDCVLEKNMNQIASILTSALGRSDLSLLERLKEGISSHFDFVASNPLLPRFILTEIISHPERYELLQEKLVTTATEIFEKTQKEIDDLSTHGVIEWIDAKMLFMNIISLNIFPFLAYPIAEKMMGDLMTDPIVFAEKRKKEITETIISRLKKA